MQVTNHMLLIQSFIKRHFTFPPKYYTQITHFFLQRNRGFISPMHIAFHFLLFIRHHHLYSAIGMCTCTFTSFPLLIYYFNSTGVFGVEAKQDQAPRIQLYNHYVLAKTCQSYEYDCESRINQRRSEHPKHCRANTAMKACTGFYSGLHINSIANQPSSNGIIASQ